MAETTNVTAGPGQTEALAKTGAEEVIHVGVPQERTRMNVADGLDSDDR